MDPIKHKRMIAIISLMILFLLFFNYTDATIEINDNYLISWYSFELDYFIDEGNSACFYIDAYDENSIITFNIYSFKKKIHLYY